MNWTWIFPAIALVVAAIVAAMAMRRPILFRMALRNALRRPKQTMTVIAGLMIGTAIISAALVAGQSATSAIRGAVYDALGEVDETVRLEGFYFFPEDVASDIQNDPDVKAFFESSSTNIFWDAATDNPETDLFEPGVTMVGFVPEEDRAFGKFELVGGGSTYGTELAPNEVIINSELAEALEAKTGDTITAAFTKPSDPLIPVFDLFGGLLGAGLAPDQLLPLAPPASPISAASASHVFEVPPGSISATFVLFCGTEQVSCQSSTTLTLNVVDPRGNVHSIGHAPPTVRCSPQQIATSQCAPEPNPLWLNVTAAGGDVLTSGGWTLQVRGEVSTRTPYGIGAVAVEPVYNLTQLQERSRAIEDLADQFDDFLDTDLFGDLSETEFIVAGISNGGKGNLFDLGPSIWVRQDTLQDILERDGQVNYIKFSNPGGVASGVAGTEQAEELLAAALATARAENPDQASIHHLVVKTLKRDFLTVADDAGELMTGLMIFAGSLSIITGLLLIVNIFTMLAEERRSELGMARAVGLSRKDLVRLFMFEGSLYAVAAAIIGALLGLVLAFGMIVGLNAIIQNQGGDFPPIPYAPQASAVPIAFATGALLTFVTIFFASRRQSRLNIVRAIRQIDEPTKTGAKWLPFAGAPVAAAGIAFATIGWLTNQFTMMVFGPVAIAVGVIMILRPFVPRKRVDMSVAAIVALYMASTIFLITDYANRREANIVGPMRGVMMTLCIVVIVSYWQTGPRLLGRALSKFKRLRAIAAPAVAYPQHKRFRTGMTLAMFSIVILSLGFFSIFGSLFEVDASRHTGGFDVEATTTLQVENLDDFDAGIVNDGDIRAVERIADFRTFLPDFITVSGEQTGQFGPPSHHVYGIDESFLDSHEFRLLWTLDGLSEDEAYAQLFERDDVIIVGYPYSTDEQGQDLSHEVGELLTIHAGDCHDPYLSREPGNTKPSCPSYTIIGIQEQYHFPGVWLAKDEVTQMFPQHGDLFLYDLMPGVDPEVMAKDLERNYREVGMDAAASQVLVQEQQKAFNQILNAMKVFLGLGLIVGVLSLGIITGRSVLERRQEIGMLRALGYTGNMIRRIFFIEVTLIILMGAFIGILASIVVTYGLWYAIIRELQYPYTVPWADIGILLLVSYVVALLATAAPIMRAARIPPAEALRYIE